MAEKEVVKNNCISPTLYSKGQLALVLSKIKGFAEAKVSLEQYQTDSEVAASMLWNAFLLGDLQGKNIIDLGSGTGILGLGTMLLGASELSFTEIDKTALEICKNNYTQLKSEYSGDFTASFRTEDVSSTTGSFDIVVMNPPFGMYSPDGAFLLTCSGAT